jgi:hypothetical protein
VYSLAGNGALVDRDLSGVRRPSVGGEVAHGDERRGGAQIVPANLKVAAGLEGQHGGGEQLSAPDRIDPRFRPDRNRLRRGSGSIEDPQTGGGDEEMESEACPVHPVVLSKDAEVPSCIVQ